MGGTTCGGMGGVERATGGGGREVYRGVEGFRGLGFTLTAPTACCCCFCCCTHPTVWSALRAHPPKLPPLVLQAEPSSSSPRVDPRHPRGPYHPSFEPGTRLGGGLAVAVGAGKGSPQKLQLESTLGESRKVGARGTIRAVQ